MLELELAPHNFASLTQLRLHADGSLWFRPRGRRHLNELLLRNFS